MFAFAILFLAGSLANAADLAVVIDDLGYHAERDTRVLNLHGPLTVAVLPNTPGGVRVARQAAAMGKEVILHQPMEALASPWNRREPSTLTTHMSSSEFENTFEEALDGLPNLVGVSNHTGSLLTADPSAMRRLMRIVRERKLFFLDSRTTAATVAQKMAIEAGVPTSRRDVFLDNVIEINAIHAAFLQGLSVARRNGKAVIIGHPHEDTVRYLEYALRVLPPDIRLVSAGYLARSTWQEAPLPQQMVASPGVPPPAGQ
ncbi:MAG: divergent polysaccharide deacetylase family protein [Pseudomonadales bacterium]